MDKIIKQLRSQNTLRKPVHTAKRITGRIPPRRVTTICNKKLMEREILKKEFKDALREAFREVKLYQEGKIELPNAKDIVFD